MEESFAGQRADRELGVQEDPVGHDGVVEGRPGTVVGGTLGRACGFPTAAPRKAKAPGTAARTREKSSAPDSGWAMARTRSGENTSATVSARNAACSAALTVSGYSSE